MNMALLVFRARPQALCLADLMGPSPSRLQQLPFPCAPLSSCKMWVGVRRDKGQHECLRHTCFRSVGRPHLPPLPGTRCLCAQQLPTSAVFTGKAFPFPLFYCQGLPNSCPIECLSLRKHFLCKQQLAFGTALRPDTIPQCPSPASPLAKSLPGKTPEKVKLKMHLVMTKFCSLPQLRHLQGGPASPVWGAPPFLSYRLKGPPLPPKETD